MAQVLVRDLDPIVVDKLKLRARRHQRSLQAEVKGILEEAARMDAAATRTLAAQIRRRLQERAHADSADLVRYDRER